MLKQLVSKTFLAMLWFVIIVPSGYSYKVGPQEGDKLVKSFKAQVNEGEKLIQQFKAALDARPLNMTAVQAQAFRVSQDYQARLLLKTKYPEIGEVYHNIWKRGRSSLNTQIIERAKEKLRLKKYSGKAVDGVATIQNDQSLKSKSAPMDLDAGVQTKTSDEIKEFLEDLRKQGKTPHGYLEDLQQALEEAYEEVGQNVGAFGMDPKKAFVTGTAAWHPDAYKDLDVLSGKAPGKELIQQSADVSKNKIYEFRNMATPEHGSLISPEAAIQEAGRGVKKDMSKMNVVFDEIERVSGFRPRLSARNQQVLELLDGLKELKDPNIIRRQVEALTGKNYFDALADIMDNMAGAWRMAPVTEGQGLLVKIMYKVLNPDDFSAFLSTYKLGINKLTGPPKRIAQSIKKMCAARLLSMQKSSSAFVTSMRSQYPALSKAGDDVVDLMSFVKKTATVDDLADIVGINASAQFAKIKSMLPENTITRVAGRYIKNSVPLPSIDKKTHQLLLGDVDGNLKMETVIGAATALFEMNNIINQGGLSPEQETQQLNEAFARNLPIVGDFFQGVVEGHQGYLEGDKQKMAMAGAYLVIGAAGLVPGGQIPALIAGLGMASVSLGGSAWDTSREKKLIEAWLDSGEFEPEQGKIKGLWTKEGGLRDIRPDQLLNTSDLSYKAGLSGTTVQVSVHEWGERYFVTNQPNVPVLRLALQKIYPGFDLDTALREQYNTARSLLAAKILETGGKPSRDVGLGIFLQLKRVQDQAAAQALDQIREIVEQEYQARHFTGEALEIYRKLKELGQQMKLPLLENTQEIFKSFSTFITKAVTYPWVRQSLALQQVNLYKGYYQGFLEIENQMKNIRSKIKEVGLNPPKDFHLTGFLEIDGPRMKDLENAYFVKGIGQAKKDTAAIHKDAGLKPKFDIKKACANELFVKLAKIQMSLVHRRDLKLLMAQWQGKKSAAAASRDAEFERVKQSITEARLPSSAWDTLSKNFEAAYAWTSASLTGSGGYSVLSDAQEAIQGQIEKLEKEYKTAVKEGKDEYMACAGADVELKISITGPTKLKTGESGTFKAKTAGKANLVKQLQWKWLVNNKPLSSKTDTQTAQSSKPGSFTIKAQVSGMVGAKRKILGSATHTVSVEKEKKEDADSDHASLDKTKTSCSYTYSEWGECSRSLKTQKRSVISRSPKGCAERFKPILEQKCTPPPTAEELRWALMNCLCECSSGQNCGKGYDPEHKQGVDHEHDGGPCYTGIGCWGDSYRLFLAPREDCAKSCWERIYDKGYNKDKLRSLIREENKKFMKPLSVKILPSANPASFGEIVTLTAQATGGTNIYAFAWSGCAQNPKDNTAKVINTRSCTSCTAQVTVTDSDGNTAYASLTIKCEALKINLTKTSPAGETVMLDAPVSLQAEVFAKGQRAGGEFTYYWEPNPDVTFENGYETKAGGLSSNTALFPEIGLKSVWVNVLKDIDGKLTTIGESNKVAVQVSYPEMTMTITPKEPLIGQEVTAVITVKGNPNNLNVRWHPLTGKTQTVSGGVWGPLGEEQSRKIVFKCLDTKSVSVSAAILTRRNQVPKSFHQTIRATPLKVSVKNLGTMGPAHRVWDPVSKGLKDKPNAIATYQNIQLQATIEPAPAPSMQPLRYKWKLNSGSHFAGNDATRDVQVNRSQTGSLAATVTVYDKDGHTLGAGSTSVSVTVDQRAEEKKKEKEQDNAIQRLLDAADAEIKKGDLEKAIALLEQANKLDPKNNQVAKQVKRVKTQKEATDRQVKKIKQFIDASDFQEAQKALATVKQFHPKYPPVVEIEGLLREKEAAHKNQEALKRAGKKQKADQKKKARSAQNISDVENLVAQGKLSEAVKKATDLARENPSDQQAATLVKRVKTQKEATDRQVKKIKEFIEASDFQEARKTLAQVKQFHPKYPPVLEAEQLFNKRRTLVTEGASETAGKNGEEASLGVSAGSVPASDVLISKVWQFGRGNGTVLVQRMILLTGGKIKGAAHSNESRWAIVGKDLLFYDGEGNVSTRYNSFRQKGGRWVIKGPFLLWGNITHVLKEVADVPDPGQATKGQISITVDDVPEPGQQKQTDSQSSGTPVSVGKKTEPNAAEQSKTIVIPAADFVRSCNVAPASGGVSQYGQGVILNAPPYNDRPNCAEYRINTSAEGTYQLEIEYAAAQSRPIEILLNGRKVAEDAIAEATGCWTPNCQQWSEVADIVLQKGSNTILLQRGSVFPHIRTLRLRPVSVTYDQSARTAPTTTLKSSKPENDQAAVIVGTWHIKDGPHTADLEFSSPTTGRIRFHIIGKWEPLSDIKFDSATGGLTFKRVLYPHVYTGKVTGENMSGAHWGGSKVK